MPQIANKDVTTGKITYVKPGEKQVKVPMPYVSLPKPQFDTLLKLAHMDGFVSDAATEKGTRAQNTRQVQQYLNLAVEALIVKRQEEITAYDVAQAEAAEAAKAEARKAAKAAKNS